MDGEPQHDLTREHFQTLNRLIGGYRVSRAIAVVVSLGVHRAKLAHHEGFGA